MTDDSQTLCSRCAAEGCTCCQGTAVFLTRGDLERIGGVLPEGGDVFWEERQIDLAAYAPFLPLDSDWGRIFGKDGTVRIIRHREGGDCVFLGENGCALDLETRPLVCRLYPYDYNQTTLKGVHGHLCPSPENGNGALLLAFLGMNRNAADEWRKALYREIADEYAES